MSVNSALTIYAMKAASNRIDQLFAENVALKSEIETLQTAHNYELRNLDSSNEDAWQEVERLRRVIEQVALSVPVPRDIAGASDKGIGLIV